MTVTLTGASRAATRHAGRLFWLVLVGVVAASVAAAATQSCRPLDLLGVILVTAAQVAVCRRSTRLALPFAAIPIVIINAVGYFGYFYYERIASSAAVSADLPSGTGVYHAAAAAFAVASAAITLGTVCAGHSSQEVPLRRMIAIKPVADLRIPSAALLLAGVIPLLMLVLGYTPSALLERSAYDVHAGPTILVSAGTLVAPIGVLAIALLMFTARDFLARFLAAGLIVAYITCTFAMGSRSLGIIPLSILLAWALSSIQGDRSGPPLSVITGALLLSLVFLNIALTLRGLSPAGLRPFTDALRSNPTTYLRVHPAAEFGNILFAVPLAGTIQQSAPGLPAHDLVTSLSPLPGRFTDWGAISPTLRINADTPYSALGELVKYGWLTLVLYFGVVSLILTRLQLAATRLAPLRRTLLSLALATTALSFGFGTLQYNLRSDTRGIWYTIAAYLVFRWWPSGSPSGL